MAVKVGAGDSNGRIQPRAVGWGSMSNYKGMGRFGFAKARHGDLLYWHLRLDSLSGHTYGVSFHRPADPERVGFHVSPVDRLEVAMKLRNARCLLREKVRQEDALWLDDQLVALQVHL